MKQGLIHKGKDNERRLQDVPDVLISKHFEAALIPTLGYRKQNAHNTEGKSQQRNINYETE